MTAGAVLLAVDGEPHTRNAIDWALTFADAQQTAVVALHVKDPYLRQFYNDIYAQGREEYLAHIDRGLEENAARAARELESLAGHRRVPWSIKIEAGDPVSIIGAEVQRYAYRLIVLGRRPPTGRLGAWRSRNLPAVLAKDVTDVPLLIVPG